MTTNRSMPTASVIPVLAYPDVAEAAAWLSKAFGFRERLRIGSHRVQLVYGDGAIVAAGGPALAGSGSREDDAQAGTGWRDHSIMVRVEDVDAHFDRAVAAGAWIVDPPADYPYGERQYTAQDPGGHRWTFSASIADVDPATWGGELLQVDG
jgi:uncharacterized glyoxalase superfamily protein PhnB